MLFFICFAFTLLLGHRPNKLYTFPSHRKAGSYYVKNHIQLEFNLDKIYIFKQGSFFFFWWHESLDNDVNDDQYRTDTEQLT